MKALIFLSLALAAAVAHAQQPAPCLKLSQVKVNQGAVHQDGATEIRLKFAAQKFGEKHCRVLTESPDLGQQTPILEIQDETGLTAQVAAVGALRLDQSTIGATILKAQEISATLNIAATHQASLGKHKLAGTIRYKVTDNEGSVSEEVLSFNVPIKVEHSIPAPGFMDRHPVWTRTVVLPLAVIAAIALLPVAIVLMLLGVEII
jgi:hypothetical protein